MMATPEQRPDPARATVDVALDDGIAWVTMDRPEKRNAMNPAMCAEMTRVLEALEVDPRCGVIVLTGAGESFSAGMDLKELFRDNESLDPEAWEQLSRRTRAWQNGLLRFHPKPTIAMVNGWCFGGAFNVVVSCDFAVAADEAIFGLSEINWGSIPAGTALKAASTVMRPRDVLYYALTGETFSGAVAERTGLVNRSVPLGQLRDVTRQLAVKMLGKNRAAARAIKQAFRRSLEMSWENAEDYFVAKLDQLRLTDPEQGRREGLRQFLDEKSYRPGLGHYERG
jgi:trans-feruloyl-CoA hydratase/vanillin synthase